MFTLFHGCQVAIKFTDDPGKELRGMFYKVDKDQYLFFYDDGLVIESILDVTESDVVTLCTDYNFLSFNEKDLIRFFNAVILKNYNKTLQDIMSKAWAPVSTISVLKNSFSFGDVDDLAPQEKSTKKPKELMQQKIAGDGALIWEDGSLVKPSNSGFEFL